MFFTILYMYATVVQWWRLSSLKNKLNGTLNSRNALLVCNESVIYDTRKMRSFENLLFRYDDRIGCTIVPKQKINLSQWVTFPKDHKYFPIYFSNKNQKIGSPNIYVLLQAVLENYIKHSAEILQVENFGELVAWKATDNFEAILKTDIDKLTRLVHCYSQSDVDINHELKLLRIETVDIEGAATKIKYDRQFSEESTMRYSYAPVYWKKFVDNLRDIYSKIRDSTNPKITIEIGATKSEDIKIVPVSEVKPIKKDSKKSEDKNMLEVGSSDYRRHKSSDHKRDKSGGEKHTKTDLSKTEKDEHKHKSSKEVKTKEAEHKRDTKDDKEKHSRKDAKQSESKKDSKEEKDNSKLKDKENLKSRDHKKDLTDTRERHKKDRDHSKLEKGKSKTDLELPAKSAAKPVEEKSKESKNLGKRSTSSEKKLVKSVAVCEETDGDIKEREPKNKSIPDKAENKVNDNGTFLSNNGSHSQSNGAIFTKYDGAKPPNILVYADSPIAKENVKVALSTMLNREKYTIYDLPTNPKQLMWNGSTILVVVCGTVPPNLTSHLLQYLLNGGQLLCLCSDLLYSVLHTFTTAEVREHELVRFTYGRWKQVKMMHHIFCYQASPAKKQFSKDSDHSNPGSSGNGSSPIAPRTPSVVEIQHNGKEYTIQVQVLGTEETWQTPSLLLASVKGGEGRAIFSQVHLEIDPNEYEDDENKFEALKDSDQARMEILKDILSNHLDIDCTSNLDVTYTPAYFLGRHDLKLSLLSDCDRIKDNTMVCEKITLKFCGKDEKAESITSSFLPVFIHSCPSNFSTVNYFEALETEHIGRLVLYCDVLASSQYILSHPLTHGIVVIPRQQTQGVGRSNNVWISPVGSANFSMQLHIPTDSPLYSVLSLVQHLVMVGIVHAIKNFKGCQNLDIGIKWPNDLYANGSIKIGGLLVKSFISDNKAVLNIGCGVNLDNSNPTLCVNDLIRMSNLNKNTFIYPISYEKYFAAVFNEIEHLLNTVQGGNIDYLYDLYYKYWLHKNSDITVTSKEGEKKKVKIIGIDDDGYLKVRSKDGAISSVQPDGNTFDMLKGLIAPKAF